MTVMIANINPYNASFQKGNTADHAGGLTLPPLHCRNTRVDETLQHGTVQAERRLLTVLGSHEEICVEQRTEVGIDSASVGIRTEILRGDRLKNSLR